MKIKDLPKGANLQEIKVKLPDDVYKASSLPMYGIKNRGVYLLGWTMGDFFVKTSLKSSQIYPMFWLSVPDGFEEWDVVDEKCEHKECDLIRNNKAGFKCKCGKEVTYF